MKKLASIVFAAVVMLGLTATTAAADPAKGQKIYQKVVKKLTGVNGIKFCAMHTQDEWEAMKPNLGAKLAEKFPKMKSYVSGSKWAKHKDHLFDFAYEYASDSGNVPAC